jgi:hypothetical protein
MVEEGILILLLFLRKIKKYKFFTNFTTLIYIFLLCKSVMFNAKHCENIPDLVEFFE